MRKEFDATLKYRTVAGRVVTFKGRVLSVPGVDIFKTIREVAVARQKKGQIGSVIGNMLARPV